MPAERTTRTKPRTKTYALPPIAGAGDDADVHAARTVVVGAVEDKEGEGEEEEDAVVDKVKVVKKKGKKTAGIVYISRLPPGMTPHKVRHLMAKWGEVGRVYAQRRDAVTGYNPDHHKKKERHKSADFTEAWVEFLDKSVGKTVAQMLNAQVIGGKKGDRWRDDIWTMRYLSGFKWEMLGEQVAYERQVHQSRVRAEMQRSRTEQNAYLQNVELARVLKKRADRAEEKEEGTKEKEKDRGKDKDKAKRAYRQREVVDKAHGLAAKGMDDVLGSLF
ncbi:hypothetical protein CspHIS471_0301430 [Cutaneotrichosporon sp. HIS471]|nr:hypothetical protein CspHIS471_0301430 [Cutaneotrichosporon sp. HIS471]